MRKATEEGNEGAHDQSGSSYAQKRFRPGHLELLREIGNRIHTEDIEEHPINISSAHSCDDLLRIVRNHRCERNFDFGPTLLELGKLRRFHDVQPNIEPNQNKDEAEHESETPAPSEELLVRQTVREQRDDARRQARPDRKAHLRKASMNATLPTP